jgi:hypothetical protein
MYAVCICKKEDCDPSHRAAAECQMVAEQWTFWIGRRRTSYRRRIQGHRERQWSSMDDARNHHIDNYAGAWLPSE